MTNRIHPTAVLGDGVELGEHNVIGPYAVLVGPLRIGDHNWIGPHAVIGTPAEHRDGAHPVGWEGELGGTGVEIGHRNRIREFVSIHQGTHRSTRIGDECYLLARSHAGHDVVLDDHVTLACNVALGGHTHVWSHATLGLGAVVHQWGQVGPVAMVGMGAAVRGEVPPFAVSVGNPARVAGLNEVGLRRLGCPDEALEMLRASVTGRVVESELDGVPADVVALLKLWTDRETA
jgi:UDP-N-acetylglucosamine acyltransferase